MIRRGWQLTIPHDADDIHPDITEARARRRVDRDDEAIRARREANRLRRCRAMFDGCEGVDR